MTYVLRHPPRAAAATPSSSLTARRHLPGRPLCAFRHRAGGRRALAYGVGGAWLRTWSSGAGRAASARCREAVHAGLVVRGGAAGAGRPGRRTLTSRTSTMTTPGSFTTPGPGLIRLLAAASAPLLPRVRRLLLASGRERHLSRRGGTGTGRFLGRQASSTLGADYRANASGTAGGGHRRRALNSVDEVVAVGEEEGVQFRVAGLGAEHVPGRTDGVRHGPVSGAAGPVRTDVLKDAYPELAVEEDGEAG